MALNLSIPKSDLPGGAGRGGSELMRKGDLENKSLAGDFSDIETEVQSSSAVGKVFIVGEEIEEAVFEATIISGTMSHVRRAASRSASLTTMFADVALSSAIICAADFVGGARAV